MKDAAADYWPSRWGPDDQAGASNWITPDKVMEAASLIQTGEIYELGRQYEHGMPLFGQRTYSLTIPGAPTGGPFPGGLVYHDEFIVGELGQVGTQFDGLGHVGMIHNGVETFYNGFTEDQIKGAYGLQNLGVELIKPIFTRGILIDVAGYKQDMLEEDGETLEEGEKILEAGDVVTLDDVKGALERQGMSEDDILDGDVVLFHYGWGDLWMVDNAKYNSGGPGIGIEVAKWLSDQNITLVGADTFPVEVFPGEDLGKAFPVHNHLLTENGILIHENLNLARAGRRRSVQVRLHLRSRALQGRHGLARQSNRGQVATPRRCYSPGEGVARSMERPRMHVRGLYRQRTRLRRGTTRPRICPGSSAV